MEHDPHELGEERTDRERNERTEGSGPEHGERRPEPPHHPLSNPVDEPDPTADRDPYEPDEEPPAPQP